MASRSATVLTVVLLGVTAACADGGDSSAPATTVAPVENPDPTTVASPAPDTTEASSTEPPAGVQPEGFTTATVRITKVDGEVCEFCMWLADDGVERGRGLMGVTDLGEPVGMVFRYESAVDGAFFMFRTPTPLSIAWFGADGGFVSAADMTPCLAEDSVDCERYRARAPFLLAIEVFEGGLDELGITPGSSAAVVAGTEADECVLADAA